MSGFPERDKSDVEKIEGGGIDGLAVCWRFIITKWLLEVEENEQGGRFDIMGAG